MSRAQRIRGRAPARLLPLAGALLATGCLGDLFHASSPSSPGAAAPAVAGREAGLWALAPADAAAGVVVRDGALGRALALVADPDRSPARAGFEEMAQKRSGLPFNPLSAEAWAG